MAELEPVEIDINMRQNVAEESARASKGVEDLAIGYGHGVRGLRSIPETASVLGATP